MYVQKKLCNIIWKRMWVVHNGRKRSMVVLLVKWSVEIRKVKVKTVVEGRQDGWNRVLDERKWYFSILLVLNQNQWTISVVYQGKRDGYIVVRVKVLDLLVVAGKSGASILHCATQMQLVFSAYLKKIWKNDRNQWWLFFRCFPSKVHQNSNCLLAYRCSQKDHSTMGSRLWNTYIMLLSLSDWLCTISSSYHDAVNTLTRLNLYC